jgi:hypothetical protein
LRFCFKLPAPADSGKDNGKHGRSQAEQAPLRFEIEQPKEYGQYLLYSKAEIAAILRALMQKRALVSAYFNNNRSFLLTAVLAVDGRRQTHWFSTAVARAGPTIRPCWPNNCC